MVDFEIGGQKVTGAEVDAAPTPSKGEAGLFTHVLALSIGSGRPIMPSLAVAAGTVSNAKLKFAAHLMWTAARNGETLASVYRDERVRGILPPLFFHIIDLGEEAGELDGVLGRYARYLDGTPGATFRHSLLWPQALDDFTRGFHLCIEVGFSVLRSIRLAEEAVGDESFRAALTAVCDEIECGSTLSEALATQPAVFPPAYVAMIRAGELCGTLESVIALMVGP